MLRGDVGTSVRTGQFTAAAPYLEGKVIERIMAIGKRSKDGAVTACRLIREEACGLLKLFPSGGRGEIAEKLRTEGTACNGVLEQIGSINKTFGPVVPGERGKVVAEHQWLDEGAWPSVRPLLDGDESLPVMQVFKRSGSVSFCEPVCDNQSKVVVAIVKTAFGNGGVVELVDADRDELDLRAGVLRFKEPGFFSQRIFKIGVIAEGNAKVGHLAPARSFEGLSKIVLEVSMTGFR